MMIRTLIVSAFLTLLLSGCAAGGSKSLQSAKKGVAAPIQTREDLLYELMLAEIAGQREQLDVSIKSLLKAAQRLTDPAVAERATRVAYFAKDFDAAYIASKRWVALSPENSEALQSSAALALHHGENEAALGYLKSILQYEEGGLIHGFKVIVNLLSRGRGQHEEPALDVMAKIVEAYPDNAYAYLSYGDLAMLFGRYEMAESNLSKALTLNPDMQQALISLARAVYQQGRVDEALANLRLAVTEIKQNEQLRLAYGRLLLETKRYQQAKEQFQALSAAAPEDSDYLYTLALLSLDLGETELANSYFQRLIALDARVPEAHYYLGRMAEDGKQHAQAIEHYEKVGYSEYQLDAQIRIGLLLAESGRIEKGLEQLRGIRSRNPESSIAVRLYLSESSILSSAKRYAEAVDVLSEALQAVPSNTDLLYTRALLYEKVDRIDLLEQDLRAILLREPENADALNALGYTLADRTARLDEAYDLISQAIKLKPDEAAILDSMGWVLYRLGRAEEAAAYLKRAIALQYDPEIAAHFSEVLWVIGEHNAAKTLLDRALQGAPDHKTLLQVKEQLESNPVEP